ncbi:hypothetical protein [Actinoplanes sp. NPDC051851]|uniref:hypothetical protein n=1 Tax=Actinoplanes sp. NPDC051851 TaxID=3154753 RepID=UPI00343BEE07
MSGVFTIAFAVLAGVVATVALAITSVRVLAAVFVYRGMARAALGDLRSARMVRRASTRR